MNGKGGAKNRRLYRPTLEALEALRLLSSATQILPDVSVERDVVSAHLTPTHGPLGTDPARDAAPTRTHRADLFGASPGAPDPSNVAPSDGEDFAEGLSRLNRYLGRAWSRAGIPRQVHDDASQAVFVALLQNRGRTRFDGLLTGIGHRGIREVLGRETADGPDFFRAIDTVKKRFRRERTFVPLDAIEVASTPSGEDALTLGRGALQEAIDRTLTPREAALIHATLMGETPAEIASRWGVVPKTVSNEKTRVLRKLRDAMVADPGDRSSGVGHPDASVCMAFESSGRGLDGIHTPACTPPRRSRRTGPGERWP